MTRPAPGRAAPPPQGAPRGDKESLVREVLPSSVTGRIMLILDCFRQSHRHLTLTDISRSTGLPTSTVHRLLRELCEWNALERTPGGYRITMRLFEIGVGAFSQDQIYLAATPVMQDLFSVTGENVHLSVLDEHEVVFIAKLIGRRSHSIISRPGGRLPAYATASGRVMLAHSTAEAIDKALASERRKFTKHTFTDARSLRKQLEDATSRGYVVSVDELRVGTTSVAAPVLGADGEVIAALSVVGSTQTLDHGRLAPAVRAAAMSLSRSLILHSSVPKIVPEDTPRDDVSLVTQHGNATEKKRKTNV